MNLHLTDKLALVSGSTAGIGLAIATSLASEGARVIINGRTEARVSEAIGKIREKVSWAKLEGFAVDLSSEKAANEIAQRFPDVEILVNNLGIFEPKPFEEIPDDDWRRFFEVNVLSGVRLSRLYLAGMRRRNWGRIIFISSESALQSPPEMIHYGMTKTAQIAVARGLAELTAGTGITVNSVLPGPTRSEGVETFVDQLSGGKPFEEFEKEFFEKHRPNSLIKRFESTEEIANIVTFVASPLSSATTGAVWRAEGGIVKSAF
jgi:NAD(P)-dependent dehydrogenase (short-subunit alcohol dehydrogenase family)